VNAAAAKVLDEPFAKLLLSLAASHRTSTHMPPGQAALLWLSRNIKHAKLMKTQGIDASFDLFVKEKLEALSGLRPRLLSDVKKLPGARILDGVFTAVQQAVGTAKKNAAAAAYLAGFVEDVKASGFVAEAITRNKSEGVNVAPAAGR